MKTSTKLLILTAVASIIGLVITNYSLFQSYKSIDQSNPYYFFKKRDVASFKHIKIVGGNYSLVELKTGDTQEVFVNQNDEHLVDIVTVSDTLTITFSDQITRDQYSHIRNNDKPTVTINTKNLHSFTSNNGAARLYLNDMKKTKIALDNSSIAHIHLTKAQNELDLIVSGTSHVSFNQENKLELPILNLILEENGSADLRMISIDSLTLEMSDESDITIGSTFAKM